MAELLAKLKRIGDWRDSFLILAGVIYIIGYIVWAVNALRNNLGLLPAVQAQYFVAGIIPVLIIVAVITGMMSLWKLRQTIATRFTANVSGGRSVFPRLIQAYFYSWLPLWLLIGSILYGVSQLSSFIFSTVGMFIWAVITGLFDSLLFPPSSYSDQPKSWGVKALRVVFKANTNFAHWLFPAYLFYLPLVAGVIAAGAYVLAGYPNLPQELGGARPHCAYLDATKSDFSSETLQVMFSTGMTQSSSEVVRSERVQVLFQSNDFFLVRLDKAGQSGRDHVYHIKQNIVRAVTSCD